MISKYRNLFPPNICVVCKSKLCFCLNSPTCPDSQVWSNAQHSKLIYFDNAATSIRPINFVDAYASLSKTPDTYIFVQELIVKIAEYICVDKNDISLVFNASMAINLIANATGPGKTVYISTSEHISNVVPWQKLSGVKEVIFFDISEWQNVTFKENSVVSMSSTTNLTGQDIDLEEISDFFSNIKDEKNITLIVDASQTIPHKLIDLRDKKIDYVFFTAHKFFGPNGVAVVYSARHKFGVNLQNKDNWESENLDWRGVYAWNISFLGISSLFKKNIVRDREKLLLDFFRDNFPDNSQIDWINKETNNVIFLLKTLSVTAHDFVFYLEKNNIVVRSGLCCSYSPEFQLVEHNIFRVSLSFLNTVTELSYFFKLIKEYKAHMSF